MGTMEAARRAAGAALPWPTRRKLLRVTARDTAIQRSWQAARLRAAHPQPSAPRPLSVVMHAGRALWATDVDRFTSTWALGENLGLVADAFDRHGVPWFVLEAEPCRRRIVVVPAQRSGAAWQALVAEHGESGVYGVRVGSRDRRPRPLSTSEPRPGETLRVFRVYAAGGRYVSGAELGCDVQFWSETTDRERPYDRQDSYPPGTLVAPRQKNLWTDAITPQDRAVSVKELDGRAVPALAATTARPHLTTVQFPIDVVYTWVNGADPAWRASMAAARAEYGQLHELSSNAARYLSRDDLRYSLRALSMYAPWVRHVYVVTDDQVPPWLDVTQPGLTVISHRELFAGRGRLPTFNSHAIESQLHHIEGLSEHFLYLNDDVFLASPTRPSTFFLSSGLTKSFASDHRIGLGKPLANDSPYTAANKNAREVVESLTGSSPTRLFQHVPHALRRSVMFELEERVPELARTASSQFRSRDDVSMAAALAHQYAYATGRAVPGKLRYFYANTSRPETGARLDAVSRRHDREVLCLNDVDRDPAATDRTVERFLAAYFPLPSPWESRVAAPSA